MNLRTNAFAVLFAALAAASFSAQAAGPQGFAAADPAAVQQARAPQGFGNNAPTTVDYVLKNGADDEYVVLRGKFTQHIRGDKYEFQDEAGSVITAELEDDMDWSMVQKDMPMEIRAKIDRDWNSTKLEVQWAKPLGK